MNEIRVVAAALLDDAGALLVAQRPAGKSQAGLWELPGGKVEAGEDDRTALARELQEELILEGPIQVAERLAAHRHAYPAQAVVVRLVVYRCRLLWGTVQAREHPAIRWLAPGTELAAALDWSPADVPLLAAVQAVMRPREMRG